MFLLIMCNLFILEGEGFTEVYRRLLEENQVSLKHFLVLLKPGPDLPVIQQGKRWGPGGLVQAFSDPVVVGIGSEFMYAV